MFRSLLPRNEGPVDRLARVGIGVGVTSLVFMGPHTPWAWIGLVPVITGVVGSCPLYTLFGMSTCRR